MKQQMRKAKERKTLRRAIIKKCRTLSAFSFGVGVSYSTVSMVVNGYRDPTDEQRSKWSKELGVKPEELFK
jgi:hypothetical protein